MFLRKKKAATVPVRRVPKRHECLRFLDLYDSLATSSNVEFPKVIKSQVKKCNDKLDLRKSALTDEHVVVLARVLLELPIFGKINLQNNKIGPRGVAAMLTVMKDHLNKMVEGHFSMAEVSL